MAFEKDLVLISLTAASDMNAATMQYCFVKAGSVKGECHLCTAANDVPIGVLQNLPARGEVAEVAITGMSKLRAGGTDLT